MMAFVMQINYYYHDDCMFLCFTMVFNGTSTQVGHRIWAGWLSFSDVWLYVSLASALVWLSPVQRDAMQYLRFCYFSSLFYPIKVPVPAKSQSHLSTISTLTCSPLNVLLWLSNQASTFHLIHIHYHGITIHIYFAASALRSTCTCTFSAWE